MSDLEEKAQEGAAKKHPYNLREKKEGCLPFLDSSGTGR